MKPLSDVEACIQVAQKGRQVWFEFMVRLHAVFAAKTWEAKASTWTEFVQADLDISPTAATKMLKTHEAFLLSGSLKESDLDQKGVTLDKLYTGIPLLQESSPKETLEKIKLLSLPELRDELAEAKYGVHEHELGEERYAICKVCKKMKKVL